MKRLIGYGTTNSSGVATLTTSPTGSSMSGYTGKGVGELDIVAELHDDSTVVSQPYTVYDCLKYDKGILNDSETRDIYDSRNANSSFTRTSEYSKLTEVTSGTTATLKLSSLPTTCGIDLEYCQVDGNYSQGGMNFFDGNSYKTYISLQDMGFSTSVVGEFLNLRLTYGNGNVTLASLDDPTKTVTKEYTGDINALTMTTNSTITEIRIRNVKVYNG